MKVPFLDLKANYLNIKNEIDTAIANVINNTAFASGPFVEEFEKNFAEFTGAKHCIAVNSGTAALHLAVIAMGIGKGDEVIIPANTFVATAWAVSYVGAKPVFVDVDPLTYTIDPKKIEAAITQKTKAIIPVHLYGQVADMDAVKLIAKKHGLVVIEDAAQAQGAHYMGMPTGNLGDIACFSFYPGKNLGAFGEGGAITTNNSKAAQRIAQLRSHAQPVKYVHTEVGFNYRMDGIQGAVLNVKLKYLKKNNDARRRIADKYNATFAKIDDLKPPHEPNYSYHIYHLYELGLESKVKRDFLMETLKNKEIYTGLHYPIPVHLQEAYSSLGHKRGDFPVTENAADTLISLPMFPELTDSQVDYVINAIKKFFK